MKANELRILNWVYTPIGITAFDPIQVTLFGILEHHIKDLYKPIPLTEEWLLKFGFYKRAEHSFDFWKNSMWKLEEYKNKEYYLLYHCSEEVDCTMIKYVHQLQNLYFALTGEELTKV